MGLRFAGLARQMRVRGTSAAAAVFRFATLATAGGHAIDACRTTLCSAQGALTSVVRAGYGFASPASANAPSSARRTSSTPKKETKEALANSKTKYVVRATTVLNQ